MPRPFALVACAVVATGLAVGAGVLTRDEPAPVAAHHDAAPFTTTALTGYDTSTARVTRGPFCAAVDERQVEAVLGAVPAVVEWRNGDKVDVSGSGTADVVHEYGCAWTVPAVGTARAWVFAPPVGEGEARQLVKSARKAAGCTEGGPPFGSPTLALSCTKGGVTRVSFRGLFGDAWLVCEVEREAGAPPVDLADVAGRWCVGVLQAEDSAANG